MMQCRREVFQVINSKFNNTMLLRHLRICNYKAITRKVNLKNIRFNYEQCVEIWESRHAFRFQNKLFVPVFFPNCNANQ